MTVKLDEKQQAWLESQVKAGTLPSVEAAVGVAIADLKLAIEGDMEWVRPYLAEARQEIATGQGIDGADVKTWLRQQASS
jgi:hypothetical protein